MTGRPALRSWLGRRVQAVYERLLKREIDGAPAHVAVIQDGNRRYAREQGDDAETGHREGAETTRELVEWCADLGIEELTLYAFSTENFDRPPAEREHIFDLITEKLREFADADRVHEEGVQIRAIGDIDRLPRRVQEAIAYAEQRTADHEAFVLNVALAYGGRDSMLRAAQSIAERVEEGTLDPDAVDLETVERHLHGDEMKDVDLIVRTGGDERTSNFLPWHANGNEAAVFFCAPYWPEFSKVDFLQGIRTYQSRTESWRRTRALRARAILAAIGDAELAEAKAAIERLRSHLPDGTNPPAPEPIESRE